MKRPEEAKALIGERIRAALRPVPGLRSVTFVGSFVDRADLSGISDIDTVVVFDRLTPERFAMAVDAVSALTGDDVGFPGKDVRVNATLGPLKFDGPSHVVVHLMPYDLASHRQHVLKSPFTCLDWERSAQCEGATLRDLYPARQLQPADFIAARRGLASYLADLESGTISVRRFAPSGDRMIEVADRVALDRRQAGEYAFHIIHNLIVNTLKMRSGANTRLEQDALERAWPEALPDVAGWIPLYRQLRAVKLERGDAFPDDTLAQTRAFVDAFSASLERAVAAAPALRLVRHARTDLNDGTFLGTGRNPSISEGHQIPASGGSWDAVFSSPLTRAAETAARLAPGADVTLDARLAEIDYGLAEGLTAVQARTRFPALGAAWDEGMDVAFPEGEDSAQVLARVESFLDAVTAGRTLAVTHNVVMRVVAARMLGLDLRGAHRLRIGHLDSLDLVRLGGRWLPNWGPELNMRLLDDYAGWRE